MTAVRTTGKLWLRWFGILAISALFAVCAMHQVTSIARHIGLMADVPLPQLDVRERTDKPGWYEITTVAPGGPLDVAGVKAGDFARGYPFESAIVHPPGSRVSLKILRGGRQFDVAAQLPSDSKQASGVVRVDAASGDALLGLAALSGLISMGFGALLLIRSRRNRAAILLGLILISLGGQNPLDATWGPTTEAARLLFLLRFPTLLAETYLWPVFCLELSGGAAPRRQRVLIHSIAIACVVVQGIGSLAGWEAVVLPVPFLPLIVGSVLLAQILGLTILALNYSQNDANTRNRIKIVALAFVLYAVGLQLEIVLGSIPRETPVLAVVGLASFLILSTLAAATLAYAVLRQRLFDLSFAINRTLVYGAVSFTLLAAFGLAEWGADRLVPEEWHRQSALYSAGIALLLFLSFHRLRDWFERHVERLFFASWQRAEADLKRFVASGGHFREAAALCREFCAEVERFAQGAPAALYLREDGGAFALQAGALAGASPRYAEEDRAFALLAAERAPVDLAEAHSALPGATAFPMFDQLGLAGFVLLGLRPDGAHYRPDEIANLAWATQQVGFDLQALQARDLRAEIAALREQLPPRPPRRRKPRLAAA